MAISTVGNQSFMDGKPIEPGTKSHAEASRAAKEHGRRVQAGRTTTTAFEPSVGVELFFSKDQFETYVERPAESTAVATALRRAAAAGADDDELAKQAARPAGDHADEQAREVQAKRMDESFRHGGRRYDAGYWIVEVDGVVSVHAADDFAARFTKKASKARASTKKAATSGEGGS